MRTSVWFMKAYAAPQDYLPTYFSNLISHQHQPIFLVSWLSPIIPTVNCSPVQNIISHYMPSLVLFPAYKTFSSQFHWLTSTPLWRLDPMRASELMGWLCIIRYVRLCIFCPQCTGSLLREVSCVLCMVASPVLTEWLTSGSHPCPGCAHWCAHRWMSE